VTPKRNNDSSVTALSPGGVLNIDCDVRVLFIVLVLVGIGASLVASSSSFFAERVFEDHFALMRRHVARAAIALIVMVVAINIDYRVYRKLSPAFLLMAVIMLFGLFVFGTAIRNSPRWYAIPKLNATLQPSEFARLALIFFLAFWITQRGKEFALFKRGFLPAMIAVGLVVAAIAATPNYGTAIATLMIALVMLYVGGARIIHLLGVVAGGIVMAAIGILSKDYVRDRVMTFFNRGGGATDDNWQVYQSLVGLGSGGVMGVGLGNSQQQLSWLPDSYTDFIFSVLGEEMGLVGTMVVSSLFLLLVLRALKISRNCNDRFGELLVIGLGTSVFVYAALNMMVVTGLFPVTGLPLPFLSYGGSALVVNAFAMGVMLNVSKPRTARGSDARRTRARRAAGPRRRRTTVGMA
jgi:cell division protein FtsW